MKLSEEKRQKISEYILSILYHKFPESLFTSQIAKEIARDEEFTKSLLIDLKSKELVVSINKNSVGENYLRRIKWRLSNKAHDVYSRHV